MGKIKSGIYKIENKVNGKIYVGSAVNLDKRFSAHRGLLYNRKHKNKHLERSWHKHGEENFVFEVLEIVEDKERLIEREQYYLDSMNPDYNISKIAGSQLGFKHSQNGKISLVKLKKVGHM